MTIMTRSGSRPGVLPTSSLLLQYHDDFIMFYAVGVMVSMLTMWTGGLQIDTTAGACNDNHYLNGLRHVYIYIIYIYIGGCMCVYI